MSRLDQHVQSLQSRLALGLFGRSLAVTSLAAAGACELSLVVGRLFDVYLPHPWYWLGGSALACILASACYAAIRRPDLHATAVHLDQSLGLKERFSTALYARGSSDPFAQAAVADAERLADNVSLHKRFPLTFPRLGYHALTLAVIAVLTYMYLPQWDLLNREEARRQQFVLKQQTEEAQKKVQKALVEVESMPKVLSGDPAMKAAREELRALLEQPIKDPTAAATAAEKASQDVQALKDRIKDNQRVADAEAQKKMFGNMLTSNKPFEQLDGAKQSLAKGDFASAAQSLKQAAEKFQNADDATRDQMASEMGALAQAMQKAAQDPAVQKQIAQNLQKMGADQQQVKQMMDQMQQAAAGDKQAAQRLQNMAQNLARQANGGKLPAPAQLAGLMQQMQQMQGQMGAQQQAGQMAQAAQQMAQAMQQAAAAQQQANAQQGNKQGGQQSGQQQAGGQKSGQQQASGQQGQQPGQGGQQQQQNGQNGDGQGDSKQQMADAQKAMQEALQQMEQAQKDAQQAQAANSGNDPGQGEGQGQGQGKWGDQQANGQGQGQQGQGQGNGPAGWNQGGQAAGDRNYETPAPFGVKRVNSPGDRDDKGQVLAGAFVKASALKGESRQQLKDVITSADKDQTDEVDQDRIPLSSQKVVREYFKSMQSDTAKPE